MAYFVYILYSGKDRKLYVGCTQNLEERLNRHNGGYVEATKHRLPMFIIYSEKYGNKSRAFVRERFLKSLWGARFKNKVLKLYLDKISHV